MDVDENNHVEEEANDERASLKAAADAKAEVPPDVEPHHPKLANGNSAAVHDGQDVQMEVDESNEKSSPLKHPASPAGASEDEPPATKIEATREEEDLKNPTSASEAVAATNNQPPKEEQDATEAEREKKRQPLDINCADAFDAHAPGDEAAAAELSPTLRRSTRASALKAQEKIRLKDGGASSISPQSASGAMVDSHASENGPTSTQSAVNLSIETSAASDPQMEAPCKKKRKLSSAGDLDQFDCKFGIRLDPDGDVVTMTDGSVISSLDESEAATIRQKYKEMMAKEQEEMSLEKVKERECQVRELEAALCLEEAKLSMLKKIRANQQLTARNSMMENARRMATASASAAATATAQAAYKPPVAQPIAPKVNGLSAAAGASTHASSAAAPTATKSQRGRGANANNANRAGTSPAGNFQLTPQHQQILQKLLESGSLKPEQIATILHSLNPAALAALTSQISANQQKQQQQRAERERLAAEEARAKAEERERRLRLAEEEARRKAAAAAEAEAARLAREAAANTQQRIAAARTQLRRHLEQQLLQLPPPKAPVPDLSFIPNANQADFLYLLGLDLVVQRNLKDRAVFKKVDFEPYVCEECGTDFTPAWKAISGEKGDLHLYCEQCVRQAQKRKVRTERTILYKKAFQKIKEQEEEFEKQVAAGKFNVTPAVPPPPKEPIPSVSSASVPNTAATKTANFNAAALSGLSNSTSAAAAAAKAALSHSAASLASVMSNATSSSSSNAANRNLQANLAAAVAAAAASRNQQPAKQETQKKSTPNASASQQRNKRPATSASSNTTTAASSTANANNMASMLAMLASNPAALSQMQQVSNMFRNVNPMFANPQMMATFFAYMQQQQQQQQNQQHHQQQQQQQQQQRVSQSASSGGSSNNAMNALLQAIAQSQQQQQQQQSSRAHTSTTASTNHHHHHSTSTSSSSSHNQHHHGNQTSGGASASAFLQQMNPALLQQLLAAAQSRRK